MSGRKAYSLDGRPLGRVVGGDDDWLVVESGRLFRVCHAVPRALAQPAPGDDSMLVVGLAAALVWSSPKLLDYRSSVGVPAAGVSVLQAHYGSQLPA